jgi:hypothetical protein
MPPRDAHSSQAHQNRDIDHRHSRLLRAHRNTGLNDTLEDVTENVVSRELGSLGEGNFRRPYFAVRSILRVGCLRPSWFYFSFSSPAIHFFAGWWR